MLARLGLTIVAVAWLLLPPQAGAHKDKFADIPHFLKALNQTLETQRTNSESVWRNPVSGHHGKIVITRTTRTETGQYCRDFTRTWVVHDVASRYEGQACREPDATWKIRKERQVSTSTVAQAEESSRPAEQPASPTSTDLTAEVQSHLTRLGYDPGPVDGIAGPQTKAAIEAFQQNQGFPVDGEPSERVLTYLRKAAASSATAAKQLGPDAKQALIDALTELDRAVSAKIDSDVETTAGAFWDAYDIEQSRRIADFVAAPLTVIEQTIGWFAFFKNAKDITSGLSRAGSVLELASLLMGISQLQQVGENLQLALDGPTYSSLADSMLREAAESSIPDEYTTTVKLHLYGDGSRQSPVVVRHVLTDESPARSDFVRGSRTAKRQISDEITQLVNELAKRNLEAGVSVEKILQRMTEVTTAIKRSKAGIVAISSETGVSSNDGFTLGSIGALEQVRNEALKYYDIEASIQQSVVLGGLITASTQALALGVTYRTAEGKLLGRVQRFVLTPVSLATVSLSKIHATNPRQLLNELPHQMLLGLSGEFSGTWMIVDRILNYIRANLRPSTEVATASREDMPQPATQAEPEVPEKSTLPSSKAQTIVTSNPSQDSDTIVLNVSSLDYSRAGWFEAGECGLTR